MCICSICLASDSHGVLQPVRRKDVHEREDMARTSALSMRGRGRGRSSGSISTLSLRSRGRGILNAGGSLRTARYGRALAGQTVLPSTPSSDLEPPVSTSIASMQALKTSQGGDEHVTSMLDATEDSMDVDSDGGGEIDLGLPGALQILIPTISFTKMQQINQMY